MDIRHQEKGYHPLRFDNPQPPENWPYAHRPTSPDDQLFAINAPKFERHIFISRDQVLFDVNTQLSIIAAMRKNPDGSENDTLSQATERYAQMFQRWMNTHIGIAKGVMAAFVLEQFRTTDMNSIKADEETDITLLFPEWYDDTTFSQLTGAVHDYVTNATITEFLTVALSSKDPVTADKAQLTADALAAVKKYVNAAKPGRIRKPQKPF